LVKTYKILTVVYCHLFKKVCFYVFCIKKLLIFIYFYANII